MSTIEQALSNLGIKYKKYDHPPVFTVEEAKKYSINIGAGETKNLFLRNDKGDKHYLVTLPGDKRADLKRLSVLLGESKLSFASPERLKQYLDLTPGSVSPFGLINDKSKEVIVVVDNDLLQFETLGYHPNINTATLVVSRDDFKKFLGSTGNKIIFSDL